ncbi:NACHT domain-containing protein [Streptomyces sp. NPDC002926]
MLSGALCLGGIWWTFFALGEVKLADADTAGVLSVGPGLVGAVLGGWGLWFSMRGLHAQRTGEVVADELARAVVRREGAQYRQLLGSGLAAPTGRIDLTFTATATGVSGTQPAGTLEGIADYYRRLRPGRAIITGAASAAAGVRASAGDAGAGKTVLAVTLLLELAKKRDTGDPVPVRLTAASWPGSEIRKWVRGHLVQVYNLSPRDASSLVDADLVLPVIDGLDEMDAQPNPGYKSRAASLLRAVERFESGGAHCPVVITSRHSSYQALVAADSQPRIVAHIAVARVDPLRARAYLEQRVALTDLNRVRWQPALDALDTASTAGTTAVSAPVFLARALDTPWRLTLAATVFQERTSSGGYLRDPGDLISLAASGQLYGYLLDRFIGAAVAAPRHGSDETSGSRVGEGRTGLRGRPPWLDSDTAWRHLAVLARYLNENAGNPSRPQRSVAGRILSNTDLVLHELWPLANARVVRLIDYALTTALAAAVTVMLLGQFDTAGSVQLLGSGVVLALGTVVIGSRTWPHPQRLNPHRLRTRAGRRRFARLVVGGVVGGIATGVVIALITAFTDGPIRGIRDGLKFGPAMGLALGLFEAFRNELIASGDQPSTDPCDVLRGDLVTLITYGVGAGLVTELAVALNNGTWLGLAYGLAYGLILGLMTGAGRATLRYFAFLLCSHGHLPWRLGRFLNSCYQLGILRVAGTAWQFRHRELQDHLASRPVPTPRP